MLLKIKKTFLIIQLLKRQAYNLLNYRFQILYN